MENEKDAYRSKLEEQIFNKICAGVEFEELTLEEKQAYEENLRYYRDIKNVIDTAREECYQEGYKECYEEAAKEEGRKKATLYHVRAMKAAGEPIEKIMQYTKLSKQEVEKM